MARRVPLGDLRVEGLRLVRVLLLLAGLLEVLLRGHAVVGGLLAELLRLRVELLALLLVGRRVGERERAAEETGEDDRRRCDPSHDCPLLSSMSPPAHIDAI